MKTAVLKPSSHQLISLAYYLSKQKKKNRNKQTTKNTSGQLNIIQDQLYSSVAAILQD